MIVDLENVTIEKVAYNGYLGLAFLGTYKDEYFIFVCETLDKVFRLKMAKEHYNRILNSSFEEREEYGRDTLIEFRHDKSYFTKHKNMVI